MIIIPAIDLRDGKCVRLYQGRFDRETEYDRNPAVLASEYAQIGFETLHVVDLDGARYGRPGNEAAIRDMVDATSSHIQVGGGIRSEALLESWLDTGIERVVVGSLAVLDPGRVQGWLSRYGAAKIVLALDVTMRSGKPQLLTHGWTRLAGMSLWQCLDIFEREGLRHVLCTDVSRDGALCGPNFELYANIVERYPDLELQASGGVRNIDDLHALKNTGAAAAITGRALLDGKITTGEIEAFLRAA